MKRNIVITEEQLKQYVKSRINEEKGKRAGASSSKKTMKDK